MERNHICSYCYLLKHVSTAFQHFRELYHIIERLNWKGSLGLNQMSFTSSIQIRQSSWFRIIILSSCSWIFSWYTWCRYELENSSNNSIRGSQMHSVRSFRKVLAIFLSVPNSCYSLWAKFFEFFPPIMTEVLSVQFVIVWEGCVRWTLWTFPCFFLFQTFLPSTPLYLSL